MMHTPPDPADPVEDADSADTTATAMTKETSVSFSSFARLTRESPPPPASADAATHYDWLYRTCWPGAVEFASRLVGDPWLAEDVAQQAFLGVWTHWETVGLLPERAQVAYALRATRNAATDALRHRGGHPGGQPRSLYTPLRSAGARGGGGSGGGGEWSEELTYAGIFVDPTPDHDPERASIAREELETLLAAAGAGTLRRLEVLLTAHGYSSREIASFMCAAARRAPTDPYAHQYQNATTSSIKMRRSRRRSASLRQASQARQVRQTPEE